MNSKTKTILYIVIFAVVIAGAGLAYKYLSGKYKAENPLAQKSSSTPLNTSESKTTPTPESSATPEGEEQEKAIKAVDFTVYDYDGNKVKLFDYVGTPIVLNFWASWCPPCKAEMPHFNKVSEEYSKDELVFLMVDLVDGQRETVEKGKNHVEDNKYTFTVLFDTDQDAAQTYGIRSIPSTLFIDKDGYVQAGIEGGIDEETLREGIALIVEK